MDEKRIEYFEGIYAYNGGGRICNYDDHAEPSDFTDDLLTTVKSLRLALLGIDSSRGVTSEADYIHPDVNLIGYSYADMGDSFIFAADKLRPNIIEERIDLRGAGKSELDFYCFQKRPRFHVASLIDAPFIGENFGSVPKATIPDVADLPRLKSRDEEFAALTAKKVVFPTRDFSNIETKARLCRLISAIVKAKHEGRLLYVYFPKSRYREFTSLLKTALLFLPRRIANSISFASIYGDVYERQSAPAVAKFDVVGVPTFDEGIIEMLNNGGTCLNIDGGQADDYGKKSSLYKLLSNAEKESDVLKIHAILADDPDIGMGGFLSLCDALWTLKEDIPVEGNEILFAESLTRKLEVLQSCEALKTEFVERESIPLSKDVAKLVAAPDYVALDSTRLLKLVNAVMKVGDMSKKNQESFLLPSLNYFLLVDNEPSDIILRYLLLDDKDFFDSVYLPLLLNSPDAEQSFAILLSRIDKNIALAQRKDEKEPLVYALSRLAKTCLKLSQGRFAAYGHKVLIALASLKDSEGNRYALPLALEAVFDGKGSVDDYFLFAEGCAKLKPAPDVPTALSELAQLDPPFLKKVFELFVSNSGYGKNKEIHNKTRNALLKAHFASVNNFQTLYGAIYDGSTPSAIAKEYAEYYYGNLKDFDLHSVESIPLSEIQLGVEPTYLVLKSIVEDCQKYGNDFAKTLGETAKKRLERREAELSEEKNKLPLVEFRAAFVAQEFRAQNKATINKMMDKYGLFDTSKNRQGQNTSLEEEAREQAEDFLQHGANKGYLCDSTFSKEVAKERETFEMKRKFHHSFWLIGTPILYFIIFAGITAFVTFLLAKNLIGTEYAYLLYIFTPVCGYASAMLVFFFGLDELGTRRKHMKAIFASIIIVALILSIAATGIYFLG